MQFIGEAWRLDVIQSSFWLAMLAIGVAIVVIYLVFRYTPPTPHKSNYFSNFLQAFLLMI
ncbi:MAG: hypothetical protein M5U34_09615 [Chloroflexi bacterium]|nr:hypothetical protein [Chloroflexota bacterium]